MTVELVSHTFDISFNQGSLVGRIRERGGFVSMGGTVLNTLKGSGTEKRGEETKI